MLSGAHAEYDIDELNRVRGQSDYFANGQMGRFDYSFDAMGRRRYEQRDWGTADGYQFNARDELTGYQRDGDLNMDGTVSAGFWNNTGIQYDANGNRIQVTGNGAATYSVNSLNQYGNVSNLGDLGYDPKGNLTSAAGWIYTYDAQNRLTRMETGGTVITQTYDPLNRVITRNVNGAVTQNVWEGWNLIEEHRPDWSIQRCYLQGASQNEMLAAFDGNVYTTHWFWQDGRGNTSHITGDNAALLERYTYDLSGAPKFYDEWGNERLGGSVYDARFLFAGSQYLPETGLYDMRNRFYSPVLNRFLQTDPIGFAGDALNLYRYCGNDPVDRSDPMGLIDTSAIKLYSRLTSFDGGDWIKGSDGLSALDWNDKRLQAGMIILELMPAGDRHISLGEVKTKDGRRALGLTEEDFRVRDPEKQQDGSWKVTGVYTLNVKYADGAGTKAGPKSLNHTYNEEWKHSIPFDRWFARALGTVRDMNKAFHFESPWRARDALEAQLRPGFKGARDASLEIHHDGSQHNAPFNYED